MFFVLIRRWKCFLATSLDSRHAARTPGFGRFLSLGTSNRDRLFFPVTCTILLPVKQHNSQITIRISAGRSPNRRKEDSVLSSQDFCTAWSRCWWAPLKSLREIAFGTLKYYKVRLGRWGNILYYLMLWALPLAIVSIKELHETSLW